MKSIVILTILGVLSMFAGIFNYRKLILPIILLGIAAAIGLLARQWGLNVSYFNNMATFDNYAISFSGLILVVSFLIFSLAMYHYRNADENMVTDIYALFVFATIGGVILASYSNLAMLFLGVEILSIPLYVLAGSRRSDLASNEAALKYFLMGAFATGILLFGIALVYGATGSFNLDTIAMMVANHSMPAFFYVGVVMLIVAMLFKVSAAPFHFWAPDVYQGSPVLVTTFMSTVVKISAFAAFLRLFATCFATIKDYYEIIFIIAAILTLLIGNITAIYQQSVKRMLAYSGISHAGYLLIALVVMGVKSSSVIFYYSAAYAGASIIAFAVLTAVMENKDGRESFEAFKGLAKNNPLLAFCMSVAMLSLAGIPPLAGFFGKYYLFTTAVANGYLWLVFIAILSSLVSLYYYLRVIINMYTPTDEETPAFANHFALAGTLFLALVVSLGIGFAPDMLLALL